MKLEQTDFIEAGSGEKVILVHSSVAGAKQWHSLMETLSKEFHVIAINLFGYGETPRWEVDGAQRLTDQARLIEPFLPNETGKMSIVGHSFGGSVAMMAAAMFKKKVRRLVLIEPIHSIFWKSPGGPRLIKRRSFCEIRSSHTGNLGHGQTPLKCLRIIGLALEAGMPCRMTERPNSQVR